MRMSTRLFWTGRLPHVCFFFFNDTATTEIYPLSLHDALPISLLRELRDCRAGEDLADRADVESRRGRVRRSVLAVRKAPAAREQRAAVAGEECDAIQDRKRHV